MSKHDWLGLFAIIFMILAMASITGCSVSGKEIVRANEYCKGRGKVQSINVPNKVATCGSGHAVSVTRHLLKFLEVIRGKS